MGLCLKSVVLKQTCNARKGDVVRRTEGERWGVTKWPSNVHQSEVGRSWLIWFHLSCDVQCECLLQSLLSFLLGHPFFPLSEGLLKAGMANYCLSHFNLAFCIWWCICICAFDCICIRWKSKCSSPSRWRIEVKWKCPRQIIMLSRQSRTARAPAGLLAAPEFRFFS